MFHFSNSLKSIVSTPLRLYKPGSMRFFARIPYHSLSPYVPGALGFSSLVVSGTIGGFKQRSRRKMVSKQAESIFNAVAAMDVLEALPRSGYLIRGLRMPENVAAHSFATAFLAMLLADAEGEVDRAKVLEMALIHEAGETHTTDIPRTAKNHFPEGAIEDAERSAAKVVLGELPGSERYLALFSEYIEGESREAKLVRAADKLQMLCKVRFYEKAGTRGLDDFFENDQGMDLDPFPVARELLELLKGMNG
jgi:5'-deoxynucleotidase